MTGRVEKTVFISYRRTNLPWALCVYQNLTMHGYDVFFDYLSINSGSFERIILENIKARAHFLIILTPSALERCKEPNDWLRREIETAIDEKRNIVPLMLENFNFSSPSIANHLTGKLATLKDYNGLNIPADYFNEAMERLQSRYLNVTLDAILHSVSDEARTEVLNQQNAANMAIPINKKELAAQEWFERAYELADNSDEEIQYYTEAIHLLPSFSMAYNNRGWCYFKQNKVDLAIQDYNQAIKSDPKNYYPYANRAVIRYEKGDLDGVISDCSAWIQIKPRDADAYNRRGYAFEQIGDLESAIKDYTEVIKLQPNNSMGYNIRGFCYYKKAELDLALRDYDQAINLDPNNYYPYGNRGAIKFDEENFEGAIDDASKWIQLKPDDADAYYSRGNARWQIKDLQGAISDLGESIRLKPDYTEAYYKRGFIRRDNMDLQGALEDFSKAIHLTSEHAGAYGNRGLIFSMMGDYLNALTDFQKASQLKPNNASYRSSLIRILKTLGHEEEATEQEQITREMIKAESEYSQACFESICGNKDKALELLKIGLEKKQSSKEWARQDPDFENIRDHPRFKELVGE
jgi:tetratricopeptide (TPR) repeat protein